MAVFLALADFAHPQTIAQTRAAFGQREGNLFAVGQDKFMWRKFFHRPVRAGEFVVGQHRHAPGLLLGEEFG